MPNQIKIDSNELRELAKSISSTLDYSRTEFSPIPIWTNQPLHTVYIPADKIHEDILNDWSEACLQTVENFGGIDALASSIEINENSSELISAKTLAKIKNQPVEDLRIDFEDGYGYRSDEEETEHANKTAKIAAKLLNDENAPARIGIRIKPFDTRGTARAIATAQEFLTTFVQLAGPDALPRLRLTLAKVMHLSQVDGLDRLLTFLEDRMELERGVIKIELQIEVPQVIAAKDEAGALMNLADNPRVKALHIGTYDYTSGLGLFPSDQRSTHPAVRFATNTMQVVAASLGIEVSDGSLNKVPTGSKQAMLDAWRQHASQIKDGLHNGLAQGWDLHPNQLVTRYLSSFEVIYAELENAVSRVLAAYNPDENSGGILDEPATLRMLSSIILRAMHLGLIDEDALEPHANTDSLNHLSRTGLIQSS